MPEIPIHPEVSADTLPLRTHIGTENKVSTPEPAEQTPGGVKWLRNRSTKRMIPWAQIGMISTAAIGLCSKRDTVQTNRQRQLESPWAHFSLASGRGKIG
jgi:hypothetical protein